jgi:hypothetical protein
MRIICEALLVCLLACGCATGSGLNNHAYFPSRENVTLPVQAAVGDRSKRIESAGMMDEDGRAQSFILFGLVGYALSSPAGIGAIRGKFAAGEAFENSVKTVFINNSNDNSQKLLLELVDFQQYDIFGVQPRLKAFMSFRARLDPSGQTTLAGYLFDWEGRGVALLPNEEKDMLREMVEQVLVHWGKSLESHISMCGPNEPVSFPPHSRGEFYGNFVKCTYDVFVENVSPAESVQGGQ